MEMYSGKLRVLAFQLPPFSMRIPSYNEAGFTAEGVAFKTLDAVLTALDIKQESSSSFGQTRYDVQFIHGNSGNLMPNGSWSGVLGCLQRNESDIVVSPVFPSAKREQAVDFSNGVFSSESYIFGGMPPQEMPDIGVIIKIFDEKIWSITLIFMLLLVLLSGVQVLSRREGIVVVPVKKKEFYKLLSAYSAALFMEAAVHRHKPPVDMSDYNISVAVGIGCVTLQEEATRNASSLRSLLTGTPREPETPRGRFLFAIWWLVMLVLANGFCGHSRAMMMSPREGLRVRDLEHLSSLLHVVEPITIKGGFYENFFRTGSDNHRKIFKALTLSADSSSIFSKDHLLLLKEGKAVILFDVTVAKKAVEIKCKQLQMNNIYYSGPFYSTYACWCFRKGLDNRLKKRINNIIRRLHEGYVIRKWTDDAIRGFDQCHAGDLEAALETPLTLKEMKTLFFLLCECLFASSLTFLLEIAVFYVFRI